MAGLVAPDFVAWIGRAWTAVVGLYVVGATDEQWVAQRDGEVDLDGAFEHIGAFGATG
jgi:hypothetical protein